MRFFFNVSDALHTIKAGKNGNPTEIWCDYKAVILNRCDFWPSAIFCDCDIANSTLRFLREKLATSKMRLPFTSDLWLRLRRSLSTQERKIPKSNRLFPTPEPYHPHNQTNRPGECLKFGNPLPDQKNYRPEFIYSVILISCNWWLYLLQVSDGCLIELHINHYSRSCVIRAFANSIKGDWFISGYIFSSCAGAIEGANALGKWNLSCGCPSIPRIAPGVAPRTVVFSLLKSWDAIPRVELLVPRISFWIPTQRARRGISVAAQLPSPRG